MTRLYKIGGRVAELGANVAGHPATILCTLLFCAAWFSIGGKSGEMALTVILSVLAITLMQMVLHQQRKNERALHLKVDELIIAIEGARNEVAGIERLSEEAVDELIEAGPGEAGPDGSG